MPRNSFTTSGPMRPAAGRRGFPRLVGGLGVAALMAAVGVAGAPSAGATTVRHVAHVAHVRQATVHSAATAAAPIPGALTYRGGPVEDAPRVYVDYWGWQSDPSGEQPYLNRFLSSVGGTGWLATVSQYGAGWGSGLLAGTWSDPAAVPASPSDAQIQAEAANAANHFGTGTSDDVQIVVATPSGHSTPGFGTSFCAYHDVVSAMPNVTYTALSYITDAGGACGANSVGSALDGVSIVEGHELAETITDPLINGWLDANGNEIGDKCAWYNLADVNLNGNTFAMQPLWSNSANGCVMSTSLPPAAPVLAVQGTDGGVNVKQGGLSTAWVGETGGASQVAVAYDATNGPLIAVLQSGTVIAKEGSLTAGWVTEATGIKQVAVASDPTHGPLIAILANDGTVYAKEGGLSTGWVTEATGVSQVAVASDAGHGPLIAILQGTSVLAKEGGLSNAWVTETGGASQISVASDTANGPLIAVLESGTVYAKEGSLAAGWVLEATGVSQVSVASDAAHGPLIAVLEGTSVTAKEGGLSTAWVYQTGGASQVSVASDATNGPLIAALESGTVYAKQGSLNSAWVTEFAGAAGMSAAG